MDLELIGYVMQPEEIGCKKDSRGSSKVEEKACTNHTAKEPLNPTTLLVGCHKTRLIHQDFNSFHYFEAFKFDIIIDIQVISNAY